MILEVFAKLTIVQWLLVLISLLAGLAVGVLLEKVLLERLKRLSKKTRWQGDDVLVDSLGKLVTVWCLIISLLLCIDVLGIEGVEVFKRGLVIGIIITIAIFLGRIAAGLIRTYSKKAGMIPSGSILANVARFLVYVTGSLVSMQYLGIPVSPIMATLGIGGLAVALALQDTLSNLFAGLQILAAKRINPGDYVKLDSGEEGYVEDISWRYTEIRQLSNNMIIVPNSKLASLVVTNFSRPTLDLAVLVDLSVAYDSDLALVERVAIEVSKEVMGRVKGGVPEFDPFIRYNCFGDSGIKFTVILRGKEYVDQYLIKHEFIKALACRFRVEGISIPFPVRDVRWSGPGTASDLKKGRERTGRVARLEKKGKIIPIDFQATGCE